MTHRIFRFATVSLVACVAVAVAVAVGSSGAVANEIETNSSIEIEDPETYAQEIDSSTRLMNWEYDDDREGFVLRFETDGSTRITLTEAVQFSEGAGSGRIYQQRLPEGQTEIFISVPRRGGEAAVTMTTAESIAENRFSYVSTGEAETDRPPISYERVQLLVALTAIGAVGATFGVVRKRREDEDRDYERIL